MTVARKIAQIQNTLMGQELPKSGHNNYGKFDYHELEDILPPIQQECFKKELILLFEFTDSEAILKVTNWNNIEDYVPFTVPMPEIEVMKRMNIMQSEGAYITYLKKYLLSNAFLILEKCVADILEPEEEPKSTSAPVKETPIIKEKTTPSIPKPVNDALLKLNEEGKKINAMNVWAAIDQSVLKGKPALKKECMHYIKQNISGGK